MKERNIRQSYLVLVDVVELRPDIISRIHDVLAEQVLWDGAFALITAGKARIGYHALQAVS